MPTISEGPPATISLRLAHDAYTVLVDSDILSRAAQLTQAWTELSAKAAALVTDSNVAPLYAEGVRTSLESAGFRVTTIIVPAGESSKSMAQVASICGQMLRAGLDRKSVLFALGGGVVGDLAGFAAAIFQRGIPCIQIPTTIVSQVDSSVGGKTGVNTAEGKNLLGAFHQPRLVLADVNTLATLPDREFNEGFAEIIKHAAIRDASLLDLAEDRASIRSHLVELIARNVAIKATIVEEDERETSGTRALLNFGHTLGHGIEAAGGYGRFLHGEAISLGLVAAVHLSVEKAGLSAEEANRIIQSLKIWDLPTILPDDVSDEDILAAMERDKKFDAGQIRFVLIRSLGDAFVSDAINRDDLARTLIGLRE